MATIIHRLAWAALISLVILIFMGAVVRATGSGLGCPDWPTCWGCIIPPTSVDQIDVDKLDIEKFKRHAARHGIDPDTITRETVLNSFDPFHTWIEFCNRLASLPLGLFSLLLALCSFFAKTNRNWVIGLSIFSLLDVIGNAIMGAVVVRSGLKPGIITLHMALAFLLIVVLVTLVWLTRKTKNSEIEPTSKKLAVLSLIFFSCLFAEGLMGSQVREQTDEFAKVAEGADRDTWAHKLESTIIYKVHRSFSWALLFASFGIFFYSRKPETPQSHPYWILGFVLAMMTMGVIMAHISIYQFVQVLHVVGTAILLAITWHWILSLNLITVQQPKNRVSES